MIKWFRYVGYVEGVSLLALLLVAMPMKYYGGMPHATKVAGWIHGLLFLSYLGLMGVVSSEHHWPFRRVMTGFFAAILPFGTFVFDKSLAREQAH